MEDAGRYDSFSWWFCEQISTASNLLLKLFTLPFLLLQRNLPTRNRKMKRQKLWLKGAVFLQVSKLSNIFLPSLSSIHIVIWKLVGWLNLFNAELSEEALARNKTPGGRGRKKLHLLLRRHHQNDSCIQTGNDDSHFNVSLIVRGRVHKPQLLKRSDSQSGIELRPNALTLLGQTRSPDSVDIQLLSLIHI